MELSNHQHSMLRLTKSIEVFIPLNVIKKATVKNIMPGASWNDAIWDATCDGIILTISGVALFISWLTMIDVVIKELKLKDDEYVSAFTIVNSGMKLSINKMKVKGDERTHKSFIHKSKRRLTHAQ